MIKQPNKPACFTLTGFVNIIYKIRKDTKMVRHIVIWNHKDEFSEVEKKENALRIKSELEALTQCIDEIIELKVHINALDSSNRDVILNSLFENESTLAAYQIHPEHKKVGVFVGAVMQDRACIDYYE